MSRRKIKHFNPAEKPIPKPDPQPKARIFGEYHAKAMCRRLPIIAISAMSLWACAKAGVGGEYVTSYGADASGPFSLYLGGRAVHYINWLEKNGVAPFQPQGAYSRGAFNAISTFSGRKGLFATELFLACTGTEIAQYFHILGGTFDPKDVLAFGAGLTLALLVEKAMEPKAQKE